MKRGREETKIGREKETERDRQKEKLTKGITERGREMKRG